MDFPREWPAFGGASLALMGVVLCAGASRHAEDAAAWQKERRRALGVPGESRGGNRTLVDAYRVGGAAAVLVGVALAAAAAAGRVGAAARFGSGDARALGACFAAIGLGFSVSKLTRRPATGPRFLKDDPSASGPERAVGEKVVEAASWALCALWTGFGLRLFYGFTRR